MNTATTTVAATRNPTGSAVQTKAQAFLAELRRALEFMGKAYSHGVPPL